MQRESNFFKQKNLVNYLFFALFLLFPKYELEHFPLFTAGQIDVTIDSDNSNPVFESASETWSAATYVDEVNPYVNRATVKANAYIGGNTYEVMATDSAAVLVMAACYPTVTAFAIQASCTNGSPNDDAYLQISAVDMGTHYNWSAGSTYTGPTSRSSATPFNPLTDLPLQFGTLNNPTSSQAYTIRVFDGSDICYTDYTVTLEHQDCETGCDCNDFLYLNDPNIDIVHKFKVNTNGSLTEIGMPWNDGDINLPHGVGMDLNGNVYITEISNSYASSTIKQLDCDGNIINNNWLTLNFPIFNFFTIDNTLYLQSNNTDEIRAYDLCDASFIGCRESLGEWGFSLSLDKAAYFATEGRGSSSEKLYKGSTNLNEFGADCNANSATELISSIAPSTNNAAPMGVAEDIAGNIYIVVTNNGGGNGPTTIYKFDALGNPIGSVTDANLADNIGFSGSRGITYSAASNLLYVAARDDCIAVLDTNLVYQSSLSVPFTVGSAPKAIGNTKECCPTHNNMTIDTFLCSTVINEVIFLQNLINCEGAICQGRWEEGIGNTGITYNDCNNSITINALNACGTFTIASDGIGNNPQCGAFKITVNIEVGTVTAPVFEEDQLICNGGDPAAFTIATAATGSGTIAYQWQSSADSLSGYTNIIGATNATYDPISGILDTTYYRVITSVGGACSTGHCRDTSAIITVFVPYCDWGDLPDTSANTTVGDYQTLSTNNGPAHSIIAGFHLGTIVDAEGNGQPGSDALEDGVDEDGITILSSLDATLGGTLRLPLSYTNTTGMDAHLEAWMDWNNNGNFDTGELIFDAVNPSNNFIAVTVPNDAVSGTFLGLRIRISHQDNMTPYGLLIGGEVEDYLVSFDCASQICLPIASAILRKE